MRRRSVRCVLACQVLFPDMAIIVNCLLHVQPLSSVLLFIHLFISNSIYEKMISWTCIATNCDYLLSCNLSEAAVFIVFYLTFKVPPCYVKMDHLFMNVLSFLLKTISLSWTNPVSLICFPDSLDSESHTNLN